MAWTGVSRPLVGRAREVGVLLDAAAAAREGRPRVVLIEGEAGLGKTRIVQELLARLAADDQTAPLVAVGRGVDLEGGSIAYGVASQLLGDLLSHVGMSNALALQPRVVEALAAVHPALGPASPRGTWDRLALVAGFRELIAMAAGSSPVCLVVEDLHWVDESSLDLLALLATSPPTDRLLITGTLRPLVPGGGGRIDRHVAELTGRAGAQILHLDPLDDAEVAAYLHEMDPGQRLTDAQRGRIRALAQGVPLFLESLVAEVQHLERRLPTTLAALVTARLARLAEPTRRLVVAASVRGVPVERRSVREVSGLTDSELRDALGEAAREGLLDALGGGRYRLHHALVARAVEEGLGGGPREDWHERWADWLDAHGTTDAADTASRAHHRYHAGRADPAIVAAVAAAGVATRLEATTEASFQWARVLRLWPDVDRPSERTGLDRDAVVVSLYWATVAAGERRAREELLAAELSCRPAPTGIRMLWLELRRYLDPLDQDVLLSPSLARPLPWDDIVGLALRVLRSPEADRPTPMLLGTLGTLFNRSLTPDLAVLAGQVLDRLLVQVAPADALRPMVVQAQSYRLRAERRHAEALLLERGVEEDVELIAPRERHRATANIINLLTTMGLAAEAVDHGERALARLGPVENARGLWLTLAQEVILARVHEGGWVRARDLLQEVRRHREWFNVGETAGAAALIAARQGRWPEAEDWIDLCAADLPGLGAPSEPITFAYPPFLARAVLASSRGDVPGAREHLRPVLASPDLGEDEGVLWQVVLEAAHLAPVSVGPEPERRRWAELVRAAVEQVHREGRLGEAWSADVEASLDQARPHDVPDRWSDVAEGWRALGFPYQEATARLRSAESLLSGGARRSADAGLARSELKRALVLLEPLEAAPALLDVQRIAGLGRLRLGAARVPANGAAGLSTLTVRELEVARLVAEGRTNQQIAAALVVSPKTVSVHVSRIISKLEVQNRTQAAALLHRHGLMQG